MIDRSLLAALAAVINEGSFERAAARLGVTASAVSQRIRALEERVGAVLVVRSQPVTATEAGRLIAAHAERVSVMEAELSTALPGLAASSEASGTPVTFRIAVNADSLATWFPIALTAFASQSRTLLEILLADEERTADRLRSGEVLAAVTAEPKPVAGSRTVRLGALRYVATASPDFYSRHFSGGVNQSSLCRAPVLGFDRHDRLQARFIRQVLDVALDAPTHWIPSTQGFVDLAVAGLGWGMNPIVLVESHLRQGRLVELVPGAHLDVELYWQCARLPSRLLDALTHAVRSAARDGLVSAQG